MTTDAPACRTLRALCGLLAMLAACTREPSAPLTAALLQLADAWEASAETADSAHTQLDRIAARIEHAHAASPARPLREILRQVVFEDLGFAREVDDKSLRYVLLPSVLRARRGSCVGLGTLYLALAERLGLDMHALIVPGHFYVQLREEGQLHNLELLRKGEEMPDSWYHERWPITAASAAYARPLSQREVEGVVLFDIGNEQRRKNALQQAERAYHEAGQRFPQFAEAHASEGSVAHLLGELERARTAYAAAAAASPQLPGLQANISLLRTEIAAGSGER